MHIHGVKEIFREKSEAVECVGMQANLEAFVISAAQKHMNLTRVSVRV